MCLRYGPKGMRVFVSEVPLYWVTQLRVCTEEVSPNWSSQAAPGGGLFFS